MYTLDDKYMGLDSWNINILLSENLIRTGKMSSDDLSEDALELADSLFFLEKICLALSILDMKIVRQSRGTLQWSIHQKMTRFSQYLKFSISAAITFKINLMKVFCGHPRITFRLGMSKGEEKCFRETLKHNRYRGRFIDIMDWNRSNNSQV